MVEYGLNYLIHSNCPNQEVILSDNRSYSFSVKLNIVYAMKLIPENLYQNIKKLNKLRNEYGHNLEVDFLRVDLNYKSPNEAFNMNDFRKKWVNPIPPDEVTNVIHFIMLLTLGWLHSWILHKKDVDFPF